MYKCVCCVCCAAGEVKGIPLGNGTKPHDVYVSVLLDQEELYRTTTIEKAVKSVHTIIIHIHVTMKVYYYSTCILYTHVYTVCIPTIASIVLFICAWIE